MKLILTTVLLYTNFFSYAQKMTPYWEALNNGHKMKYYYEDFHENSDTILPKNVYKEYIYHFSVNGKDSTLEKEKTYDSTGLLIEAKDFAVPSKGELISLDTLTYFSTGLIKREFILTKAYYGGFDTVIYNYQYDIENRLVKKERLEQRISGIKFISNTSISYQKTDNYLFKTMRFIVDNDNFEWAKELYYINNAEKTDSIRFYGSKDYLYTFEMLYDSIKHENETYVLHPNSRELYKSVLYNEQGHAVDVLTNWMDNWNNKHRFKVKVKHNYNFDGSTKECIFYINGKKEYFKRHYYILRN